VVHLPSHKNTAGQLTASRSSGGEQHNRRGTPRPRILSFATTARRPRISTSGRENCASGGLVVGQYAVTDGPDGHSLVGFESPFLIGPNQVQVLMQITGSASGDEVLLSVGAGNGIVAVDDGGTWGGVIGLGVPFP
jgi:hypothetical protein